MIGAPDIGSPAPPAGPRKPSAFLALFLFLGTGGGLLHAEEPITLQAGQALIRSLEGQPIEVRRAGSSQWDRADAALPYALLQPGDQFRTGPDCRAILQLSDYSDIRVGPRSQVQFPTQAKGWGYSLLRGILYFFHRDRPGEFEVNTPTVSAIVRGTEFQIEVDDEGTTGIQLFDGEVDLRNPQGNLQLQRGQSAAVRPNAGPLPTPALPGRRGIQWMLYYPGVLDPDDLQLTEAEAAVFAPALTAYRQGDLIAAAMALRDHQPAPLAGPASPASDAVKVFAAALALTRGDTESLQHLEVHEAQALRLVAALREVAQAITEPGSTSTPTPPARRRPEPSPASSTEMNVRATEWMARSYTAQASLDLAAAREAARQAVRAAPHFGFARARLAELELALGRASAARREAEQSLRDSPRNPHARTLLGLLEASAGRTAEGFADVREALTVDSGLPVAWAVLGLLKISQGQRDEGRHNLQIASLIEPEVSLWRSYLARAFLHAGDLGRGRTELGLAQQKDPNDPTPPLYFALLHQQENDLPAAVQDLERSLELNDRRGVYRSQGLLDQDRAIRSANLATIFDEAGMSEFGRRQALRSLETDPASFTSHAFLANAYNTLRGAGRVDLRTETPALAEYLLANLLAPPGAGYLSPAITQQEFSRFFDAHGTDLRSETRYLSRGAWSQAAIQSGHWDGTAYALEGWFRHDPGQRPNNDLEQIAPTFHFKQALSPQDTLMFQAQYAHTDSGDLRPDYWNLGDPNLRVEETLEPGILLGLDHAWTATSHSLVLGAFYRDVLQERDPDLPLLVLFRDPTTDRVAAAPLALLSSTNSSAAFLSPWEYTSQFDVGSLEWQQIVTLNEDRFVVGARFQQGEFATQSDLGPSSAGILAAGATGPRLALRIDDPIHQDFHTDFQRCAAYGYFSRPFVDRLRATAGLAYDRLEFPENHRVAPISSNVGRRDQVSPKLGLLWTLTPKTTLRSLYSRSLGGVSLDQSLRLEPTQLGGFNQSYRSLIPEAAAGSIPGARFESAGVGLDWHPFPRSYFAVELEWRHSNASEALGAWEFSSPAPPPGTPPSLVESPASIRRNVAYDERALFASAHQFLDEHWSVGATYRLTDSRLATSFADLPWDLHAEPHALLHELDLALRFNHSSGFFGGVNGLWFNQSNDGYASERPGDDFWHLNAFLGQHLFRRQAEIRLVALNLNQRDYRVNELSPAAELPRQRTFAVVFRFHF